MTTIGIVTDSTSRIRGAAREALSAALDGRFTVVDLSVEVDDETRPDSDWEAGEVCRAMTDGAIVRTSMPGPLAFTEAIAAVHAAGAHEVLVLTLSSALSGTHGAAVAAAAGSDTVHVIDSGTTSEALAGAVRRAAARAVRGDTGELIAAEVRRWCAEDSRVFFVPATLTYLERGGRIGRAASLLGNALSIVPVLGIVEGEVRPLAKVRTRTKGEQRLVRMAAEAVARMQEAGATSVDVILLHPEPEAPREVLDRVRGLLAAEGIGGEDPGVSGHGAGVAVSESVLSTVVTAHVGPGALGIAVQTRP
ncbi:DegV family protein [Brevibacterium samyangense]|uniref:DegV family protein n=1 Tax=Brevibacterium samyangense TaxID=366888 RepID=A0ABN2TGN1_9MICO